MFQMKKLIPSFLSILVLFFSFSCGHEENLSQALGKATFSLSKKTKSDGRVNDTAIPAFVLLNIKYSNGKVQENIKLPLFSFGQSYLSDELLLPEGSYQLTQFAVLDASKVIYATPLEGSYLAEFVDDPLPIGFTITKEISTEVVPQVLAVTSTDTPEMFGLASFGFEVVKIATDLNIHFQYPDISTYDSAYIVFKNDAAVIKQKLTLNNISHIATGHVTNLPVGNWNISTSYFSTITKNYESLEKNGVTDLSISSTATDLISDETGVYIDGNNPVKKSFNKVDYYYYQLYSTAPKLEGFVRLPVDPLNPFVQITTFNRNWSYAYADRSFYDAGTSGDDRFLVANSGAFEVYGTSGDTHDRLDGTIIDITSLAPAIAEVSGKAWNFVDCLIVIIDGTTGENLNLYHVWDLRTPPTGGRIPSNLNPVKWGKTEIEERKKWSLN
jgi:hypothetical protein